MIKHSHIVSSKIKKEKGITLTALVVTIIILLILAGIGISVGRDTIESAKLMSFGTELQAMQHKVNELQQELQNKKKNSDNDGADRIKNIGQNLQNSEQENKAFAGAEVSDKNGYRYYDKNTVEELGFKNFNSEFLVNVEKRKVISLYGIEYRGKNIWIAEQLDGDNQYNVEYAGVESLVTFDLGVQDNGLLISNIQHTGNVKKSTIYYGQGESESTVNWKVAKKDTTETSCKIDNIYDDGIWYVKIEDSAGHNAIRNADVTTVTFNANGGTVGTTSKKVIVGQEYEELPIPTKDGYTFLGWNGKNLFELTEIADYAYLNTIYNVNMVDNSITIGGNKDWEFIEYYLPILKANTTYVISAWIELINTSFTYVRISMDRGAANGNHFILDKSALNGKFSSTFITESNAEGLALLLYGNWQSTINKGCRVKISDVMIEEDSTATEYEPYYITSDTKVTQNKKHTLTAQWQKN